MRAGTDQATYLLEDVKPPPANFTLNDEILEVFTGPEGVWQVLKHEHTTRGGEAADDLSGGVPLAAISFVNRILRSKGKTDKIRVRPLALGIHVETASQTALDLRPTIVAERSAESARVQAPTT